MRPEIDVNSATWAFLKARMERDLTAARTALEAASLGPTETEYLRGRIAVLRDLLRLPEPKPNFKPTDPHY